MTPCGANTRPPDAAPSFFRGSRHPEPVTPKNHTGIRLEKRWVLACNEGTLLESPRKNPVSHKRLSGRRFFVGHPAARKDRVPRTKSQKRPKRRILRDAFTVTPKRPDPGLERGFSEKKGPWHLGGAKGFSGEESRCPAKVLRRVFLP